MKVNWKYYNKLKLICVIDTSTSTATVEEQGQGRYIRDASDIYMQPSHTLPGNENRMQ